MSRNSKSKKIDAAPQKPQAVVNLFEGNSFVLGNREFTVKAFTDREDAGSYDDSVTFAVKSLPLILKVLSVFSTLETYGVFSKDSVLDAEAVNQLDLPDLIKEVANDLPELVSIVCHSSDPTITPEEIKGLAKSIMNPNLVKAVILQFKVESPQDKFSGMKEVVSELGV